MTDIDLFFRARWKTLGEGVHYQYHAAVGNMGVFYPPDARSSSFIAPNGTGRGEGAAAKWIDDIDKSMGRADYQLGEFTRLSEALAWLKVYDPIAAQVVVGLCVSGRATVTFGRGVRHWSLGDLADAPPFDSDVRKLQEWLLRSWQLLGVILAPAETLRKAVEANCVDRWALQWCRERGLVE